MEGQWARWPGGWRCRPQNGVGWVRGGQVRPRVTSGARRSCPPNSEGVAGKTQCLGTTWTLFGAAGVDLGERKHCGMAHSTISPQYLAVNSQAACCNQLLPVSSAKWAKIATKTTREIL
jgi:hypothetical protein